MSFVCFFCTAKQTKPTHSTGELVAFSNIKKKLAQFMNEYVFVFEGSRGVLMVADDYLKKYFIDLELKMLL